MTRDTPTILLVSHGQPSDPTPGETQIRALARRVQPHLPGARVRGVTLAAKGVFEQELAQADTPIVLPIFMADGYFTSRVLPDRIGTHAARILPPFGLNPDLPAFTARWLGNVMQDQNWGARDTTLFVAGHGSGRSPRPAQVTMEFAKALHTQIPFSEIRVGFVEQSPFLADAAHHLPAQSICLPFFALERGHVLEDLPKALDANGFQGLRLPPFGSNPDFAAYLADDLAKRL
ncbi:MAG: cobalamin biosynthesis protein CbiX [Pelagimonas sp.]|jgi:sirohydrochlorin ferrochelatase|nr:cobalamin biosynthesis protein CbiX [Pelagimonas sp.]